MNTKKMLVELAKLLDSLNLHPKFYEEFAALLKKDINGKEAALFKQLTTQLNNIKNMGKDVYKADSNEILKGADGHYLSIHLQGSQFNVRLLVYIDDYDIPYFLCAFNEKQGKRSTDYSTYTLVMKERIKFFLDN